VKNFVSCHVHPKSLDSGSTPKAFVEREIELGTGYTTVTDHGSLAACREVYELAHSKKLTPILGIEAYFRDDDCPILTAAGYPKNANGAFTTAPKYNHVTVHFLDQAAYECGVKLLSKADARLEETLAKLEANDRKHGHERKPLFKWQELEELGSYNVTMTTGCLIGMVQRHVLENNDFKTAEAYYRRLKEINKPGALYVEVFPHDCSKNWVEGVFVTVQLEDGTTSTLKWNHKKWLKTNVGEIRAGQLAAEFNRKSNRHEVLEAVKHYSTWSDLPPGKLLTVDYREEFVENECAPWAPNGDVQAGLNKVVSAFAKRYGDKILVADDSHYAHPEEKIVQDVRLAQAGAWRFYGNYHRQSNDEAYDYFKTRMGTKPEVFEEWVENSHEWASRFKDFVWNVKPELPTKFYEEKYTAYEWSSKPTVPVRDHPLMYTMELIKKHGRMDWKNKAMVERLQTEIKLLHNNGTIDLLPYFFIDEEVCDLYERNGLLTGPGRGSAAGLLLTYLLGITHVDPLRYSLSLERFLTLDRIKSGRLPDIDQDLPNRDILTDPESGWLWKRFGDHAAQISVDSTLKLRMAVQDVARYRTGHVDPGIVLMTKKFKMPPQGVSDHDFVMGYETDEGHQPGSLEEGHENYDPVLKQYTEMYPEEWTIVQKCLGLARQKGRHACAFVVANRPIHEFIPLTTVSDVRVTAYTASSVEAVGGLKMDFLVVNSLNDLGDAIQIEQQRYGHTVDLAQYPIIEHKEELLGWGGPKFTNRRFSLMIDGKRVPCHRLVPVNGRFYDIWDLAADQDVFEEVAQGRTETVFQFCTPSAVQWLGHFNYQKPNGNYAIDSIDSMAAFTALDRPGPLDMYVRDPDDASNERRHNLLVEYARRARGATPSPDILSVFNDLVPETHGVMTYQESLQKVYQSLTGCSGSEAEEFRADVAKKKKAKIEKAYGPFIEKAGARIGKENAEAAWQFFLTWAKYGFNRSVLGTTLLLSKEHGLKELRSFVPGEHVLGVDDFGQVIETEVIAVHDHGNLPAVEAEFDDGYKVTVTLDHKFLTSLGQRPLSEIWQSDLGVLCGDSKTQRRSSGLRLPEGSPGVVYSDAPLSCTGSLVRRRVVRVSPVGFGRMYDLEVSHPKHNYLLPNGVITSNSHAVCYSVIGYACAYFKRHFKLEWWCSVLKNASKNEVNEKFWKYAGQFIDLPDVQYSGANFEIQNDRIRAPLSLLQGVGETAHKQLNQYAPYTDIDDFCRKIQQHREATKFLVKRVPQEDGKAKWVRLEGEEAARQMQIPPSEWGDDVKWRLGHNALNRKVVYTMIVSGAMDSLFPKTEERLVLDNLVDFERATNDASYKETRTATGKIRKKPKPKAVDEEYVNLSGIKRYQMRKAMLAAYSEDLLHLLVDTKFPDVGRNGDGHYFRWQPPNSDVHYPIGFATCTSVEAIERNGLDDGERITIAVAAYVEDTRTFSYGDERREACELVLDVEGGRFKFVKWGGKNITIPEIFKTDLKGAVVIAILTKYKSDRPFGVDDLILVQPPLSHTEDAKEDEDE
jgi:DNA polymerase III alpha subunit